MNKRKKIDRNKEARKTSFKERFDTEKKIT